MPKVLRILNRFNLGGPTYNAVLLTKFLAPEYETLLIGGAHEPGEESSLFIANQYGINPIIIPEMRRSINPFTDRKALLKIQNIINEFKPDIVHTHASKAGALGRKAAFNCGVPVVVHTFHGHVFHSYFNSVKTAFVKKIERSLAKKSSAIIAISNEQKVDLTKRFKICDESKTHVIPLGFDLKKYTEDLNSKRKKFRNEFNIGDDEIVITITGRFAPVKNHEMFLKSAKKVFDSSKKKIRFFIVGDGDEKEKIIKCCQNLQLPLSIHPNKTEAVVTFTSWRRDIDVVNAGSDIIALTSLNEGTPVSLIEAQASGKPIVSTLTGGIQNIVLENKSALLCNVNDVEKFSENLLYLIENEQKRIEMCNSAQAFVLQEFDYKMLCNKVNLLYKSLIQNSQNH